MSKEKILRKLEREAKKVKSHGEEDEIEKFKKKLEREEKKYERKGEEEIAHKIQNIEKEFESNGFLIKIIKIFLLIAFIAFVIYYLYQKGILKFI